MSQEASSTPDAPPHSITFGIGAEYVAKEPMMPERRTTVAVKAECSCGWYRIGPQVEVEDAAQAHVSTQEGRTSCPS